MFQKKLSLIKKWWVITKKELKGNRERERERERETNEYITELNKMTNDLWTFQSVLSETLLEQMLRTLGWR